MAWELTANFARTSTYFAMLFVLAQYLQQGLGRSATYSGLVLVSWVAAFGVAAPVTRRLPPGGAVRRGARVADPGGRLRRGQRRARARSVPRRGAGRGRVRARDGVQLTAGPARRGPAGRGRRPKRAGQHLGPGRRGGRSGGYGTVYFALAARPAHAFAVVTAALAASGLAGGACSFLSARRRAAEVPAARSDERVAARVRYAMIVSSFGQ